MDEHLQEFISFERFHGIRKLAAFAQRGYQIRPRLSRAC
jgi:hypothetical protein